MDILPYYKIEKTEEGKEFFFSHYGYFNFFDEYLILNFPEGNNKVFLMIVNRTGFKLSGTTFTEKQRFAARKNLTASIKAKKPEEMFEDFPELKKFNLKNIWTH